MSAPDNLIRLTLPRAGFTLSVDLCLPGQGITVLFGASGSGKTSVLRCVAGLERAGNALVKIDGQTWQDDAAKVFLPTWQRPLGYVFQEASLFEHLDVQGNLQFGLSRSQAPGDSQALDDAVELLGIGGLLKRRTQQLSGGERQRIAIARALSASPRLLLLDEPLAALDYARRQDILPWLERLRDELKIPMLYVTHSADEAARLGERLVVLEQGQVKAAGPVAEVLVSAGSPLAAGDDAGALLEGRLAERDERWHLIRVDFSGGSLWLRDNGAALGQKLRLRILARDVSITLDEPQQTSIQNHLPCVIESITADHHPSQVLLRVYCGDTLLLARITGKSAQTLQLCAGKAVWVQVKSVVLIG